MERAHQGDGVSFVIPAHNEEAGIVGVLTDLQRVIKTERLEAEIVVVDDGSADATAAVAASHGARVVSIPMNVGYGAALKRGLETARYSRIVITDGDGSYPMDVVGDLVRGLDRFDLVIARRTGGTYYRSLITTPFRLAYLLLVWFVVGRRVPDPNSGLRAFRREGVEEFLPIMCHGFSFTTSMTTLYLLAGRTVSYLPIAYRRRVGRSKVRFFRDMLRTGQLLVSVILLYNPIKLFVLLAGGAVAVALPLFAVALWRGSAAFGLGGALFVLFGGVFLCFGFLADILANSRRNA